MHYQRKDRYYKKAKQEGFRSRAAYKLVELDQKFKLFRPGMTVVDLGCSPGSWMQVIARAVGAVGRVIGLDTEVIPPLKEKNADFIRGDIREERTKQQLLAMLGSKVDMIVSDMAPNLSGIKFQDHYNSYELAEQAFKICRMVLKENGSFLVKIFPGEELEQFKHNLQSAFLKIQTIIPGATRKTSTEVYIFAKGFRLTPKE